MTKKRIAFLMHNFEIGGVEKVFITYANALVPKYDVTLIVLSDSGVLQDTVCKDVKIINLHTKRWRLSLPSLVLCLLVRKFHYLVSGVYESHLLSVLASYITFRRTRVITSKHNIYNGNSGWLLFVMKHSEKVFAVSGTTAKQLIDLGVEKKKISKIYNPIDIGRIRSLADVSFDNNPSHYIVYVGRLYPIKNLPLLIHSFALFHQKYPDYKLLLVGDGPLRLSLENYSMKLGVSDDVLFVGAQANPYPYIRRASLLALTSFSEGLSLVVAEAICLGKTVVCTPCVGPEEIVMAPEYGYISSNKKDARDFCDKMEYAIEHPISREKLQERSEMFSLNTALQQFEAMLN